MVPEDPRSELYLQERSHAQSSSSTLSVFLNVVGLPSKEDWHRLAKPSSASTHLKIDSCIEAPVIGR